MERNVENEITRLRRQITELQERGSELEKDKRLYRRLYQAARMILEKVLINASIASLLYGVPEQDEEVHEQLDSILALYKRIEQLEFDSNTSSASVMREYIKAAKKLEPFTIDTYGEFVHTWRNRFIETVGDPDIEKKS